MKKLIFQYETLFLCLVLFPQQIFIEDSSEDIYVSFREMAKANEGISDIIYFP